MIWKLWFLLRREHVSETWCWCRPTIEPQIKDGEWIGNLVIHKEK